jgi:hypothetical protein
MIMNLTNQQCSTAEVRMLPAVILPKITVNFGGEILELKHIDATVYIYIHC